MSKKDEALKLALEALEYNGLLKRKQAIAAIREALAEQPAHTITKEKLQQIVASYVDSPMLVEELWHYLKPERQQEPVAKDAEQWGARLNEASWAAIEAWNADLMGPMSGAVFNNIKGVVRAAILKYVEGYTSPPASKPWVGLTSKEREELDAEAWHFGPEAQYGMRVSEMTEAKLREKNA